MNTSGTVTTIKVNMLMDYLKDSDNISGLMVVSTKVISSKDSEVGTVCGMQTILSSVNLIKGTIPWIRNLIMACINGKMVGFIKVTFKMIIEMGMDNFSKVINACIEVIG